jgi:hypothetical protein
VDKYKYTSITLSFLHTQPYHYYICTEKLTSYSDSTDKIDYTVRFYFLCFVFFSKNYVVCRLFNDMIFSVGYSMVTGYLLPDIQWLKGSMICLPTIDKVNIFFH